MLQRSEVLIDSDRFAIKCMFCPTPVESESFQGAAQVYERSQVDLYTATMATTLQGLHFFLEIIDFILPLHSTHLKHRQQLANA